MHTAALTCLLLYIAWSCGQDLDSDVGMRELIKLSDVCTCSEIHDSTDTHFVLNVLCSGGDKTEQLEDLDKIEWPPNPHGLKIAAQFQGLGITILAKLPPNFMVESLSLSSNAISTYWPDPFSDLPNLRSLSFYQNELYGISPDLFTNMKMLEDLDLSYNKLSIFSASEFKSLKHLKRLNLQSNNIENVPMHAFKPLLTLEELDLSRNSISGPLALRTNDGETLKGLKRLFLAANRITAITKNSFQKGNSIDLLDLSYNLIATIEEDAFLTCTNLQELNLANNNITFVFGLPPTLQIAILKTNTLYNWPQFSNGIKLIDLSYNRLSKLYDEGSADFENLEVLDISGNQITEFNIRKKLSSLISLDLSYNSLKEIPKTLSAELLPNLKGLRLDGNPLKSIFFKSIIVLRNLYMNDLDKLTVVDDKAFSNVLGRNENVEGQNEKMTDSSCYSLYLSNCRSLSEIKRGAFDGGSLCMLDISKNNLTHIPKDLLDWSEVQDGVNLQNNPWRCNCDMEWMVDELLTRMYDSNPNFLLDWRCGSPRALQGMRVLHFYNWTGSPLCSDLFGEYTRSGSLDPFMLESSTEGLPPKVSTLTIVLSVCILVGVVIIISLMVYLVKSGKSKRARQAAIKRRRQSNGDVTHTSDVDKEQLTNNNKV